MVAGELSNTIKKYLCRYGLCALQSRHADDLTTPLPPHRKKIFFSFCFLYRSVYYYSELFWLQVSFEYRFRFLKLYTYQLFPVLKRQPVTSQQVLNGLFSHLFIEQYFQDFLNQLDISCWNWFLVHTCLQTTRDLC